MGRNKYVAFYQKELYIFLHSQKNFIYLIYVEGDVILEQLKQRRKDLKLLQKDMLLRVGMTRQQYNQLENKGNPRLDTLTLLAKGLDMELMLIPKEKLGDVRLILEGRARITSAAEDGNDETALPDDPWHNILEDQG
jgi:transcriptional regulator with XRE-family HTH domain